MAVYSFGNWTLNYIVLWTLKHQPLKELEALFLGDRLQGKEG
jgi:hypothetical protein